MQESSKVFRQIKEMKTFEVKIARSVIKSDSYRQKRMREMSLNISHWMISEGVSHTTTERRFCRKMKDMYVKRYNWYVR